MATGGDTEAVESESDVEIIHDFRQPPRLEIPTIDDHRGRGILAGDWIKPDPVMTRQETRRYVISEIENWLTGRICSHAKEVAIAFPDPTELAAEIASGSWPAARLYMILWALERSPGGLLLPKDLERRFHFVGQWAADVCIDHLRGYEATESHAKMAVEFILTDRLPSGGVIADYWNYSPFEVLRSAPPLPDHDPAEALRSAPPLPDDDPPEEEVEDGTETQLDSFERFVIQGSLEVPVWFLLTFLGFLVAYLWLLVAAWRI